LLQSLFQSIFDKETKKPALFSPMDHQSSQFEEILLPPVILAGLYSNSLVMIEEPGLKPLERKKNVLAVDEDSFLPSIAIEKQVEEPSASASFLGNNPGRINCLGDFRKNILVFVTDPHSVHLSDNELDLLGKMLQALKLSLADIAVVNTCHQSIKWPQVIHNLPAKQVIFFGVDPSLIDVPIRFPHFRVQQWNNTSFLYSPSLVTINTPSAEQTTLKKDLWKALQEMFLAS